jgi:hypothetical protein
MRDTYAIEKLTAVVKTLASSKKPIRERLIDACTNDLHALRPEQLPSSLRGRFEELFGELSGKGSFEETIGSLSEDDASRIADGIVTLLALVHIADSN